MGTHNLHGTENNKQFNQLRDGKKKNLLHRTPQLSFMGIYNLLTTQVFAVSYFVLKREGL